MYLDLTSLHSAESFGEPNEKARYGPYVLLCNSVLECLETAVRNLPVRKNPDTLNIRFQHNGIPQVSQGTNIDVVHAPDVVISSLAALGHAHSLCSSSPTDKIDLAKEPHPKFKLN